MKKAMCWSAVLVSLVLLAACQGGVSEPVSEPEPGGEVGSSLTDTDTVAKFSCSSPEPEVRNTSAPRLTLGTDTLYTGTIQRSSDNQDPVVTRFNAAGEQVWCRDDYERTGVDGRGYGLLRTATGELYAVFSVDGGSNDFNFNAANGWLSSYGSGGGAKVAVLARLNPADGASTAATFISAVLDNGRTNSLTVTGLDVDDGNIVVAATTAAAPRFTDTTRMPCPDYDGSTEDYTLVLAPDLETAVSARAPSCGNP